MNISVITPVLNEYTKLQALIPHLRQLLPSAELIVVDGGSTDGTDSLSLELNCYLIRGQRGRARQMNAGAAEATGDVLLFLHVDSKLPESAAVEIERACRNGAQWGRFDIRLDGKHWMFRVIERLINWRSRTTGIATGDQGIFIQRQLFESQGGYADIQLMEDIELSKRLKKYSGPAFIRHPLHTSSRRWEEKGIVKTVLLMWYLRMAYFLGVPANKLAKLYR